MLASEEHRIVTIMVKLRLNNSASGDGAGSAELASEEHRILTIMVKLRRKNSSSGKGVGAAELRIILQPFVVTAETRACTSRQDP